MAEIHGLLDVAARSIEPSEDGLQRTRSKVRHRARVRRSVTSVLALLLALSGMLVAVRAFSGPPVKPAGHTEGWWWTPTSPDITATNPYPESAFESADTFWAETEERVAEWIQKVDAARMSHEDLARNSLALRVALRQIGADGLANGEWVQVRELMERRQALCRFLPSSYQIPSGETPCGDF